MRGRLATTVASMGIAAALLAACGDGAASDGPAQGSPDADVGGDAGDGGADADAGGGDAADMGSDSGGGGDLGSAVLTIGEQSWSFDAFGCAFGHEATQSDVYSFSSNAFGQHSNGARVQMQAEVRDDSGQGRLEGDVIYTIYIQDIQDFESPSVSWETTNDEDPQLVDLGLAPPSGEAVIHIDGDTVTGEGYFDDGLTDEFERVFGTLEATCGSQSRR